MNTPSLRTITQDARRAARRSADMERRRNIDARSVACAQLRVRFGPVLVTDQHEQTFCAEIVPVEVSRNGVLSTTLVRVTHEMTNNPAAFVRVDQVRYGDH